MAEISYTPAADIQMSFYDNVLPPVRWSGKPLRFWYALFMGFGNSKLASCVKAVRMRFGLGAVMLYPPQAAQILRLLGPARRARKRPARIGPNR
jgi:hypothetical protein